MNSNFLVKYIRQNKKEISPRKKVPMVRTHKVGTLIAFLDDEEYIRIGWSALNTWSNDKFDPKVGIQLAKKNTTCILSPDMIKSMPLKVRNDIENFIDRAENYFKRSVIR